MIIGGGPAGNTAATYAARLGAEVTMIERDVIGGAAHLWDCIPSKTMIATGGAMSFTRRIHGMGLEQQEAEVDIDALTERIDGIKARLQQGTTRLLESQGVQLLHGSARLLSDHEVEVVTAEGTRAISADAVLIATGSRPRIPDWCTTDGERILTTRECYPPTIFPENITVIGSGVTGVEFVHMFSCFGAKVTLVVSRQQVLPQKDPEVAAVLEDDFLKRGVHLLKGARATSIERVDDDSRRALRRRPGRAQLACRAGHRVGPQQRRSRPRRRGRRDRRRRLRHDQPPLPEQRRRTSTRPATSAASCRCRQRGGDAGSQGRRARDGPAEGGPPPPRLRQGGAARSSPSRRSPTSGLAEAEAFAVGRKIRVTKVPFSATPKALINNDFRGFVKIICDPATGVVLGGSIVGRHAAELISVIALAVTANLKVTDIVESLLVHPALAEALAEAAE